jgi:hypothetical protein
MKLFAYGGDDPLTDGLAEPYLPLMPAAANEALHLLATAGRFIQHSVQIPPEESPQGDYRRCDLKELAKDFYFLDSEKIYLSTPKGRTAAEGVQTEGESILWLPAVKDGTYTVYYYAYPAKIDEQTPDSFTPALHPEAAALLPLYMASQLYKDDDVGLAALYRQEFDAGLEVLRRGAGRFTGGKSAFSPQTGWW